MPIRKRPWDHVEDEPEAGNGLLDILNVACASAGRAGNKAATSKTFQRVSALQTFATKDQRGCLGQDDAAGSRRVRENLVSFFVKQEFLARQSWLLSFA